jgi:hypothetical protein
MAVPHPMREITLNWQTWTLVFIVLVLVLAAVALLFPW